MVLADALENADEEGVDSDKTPRMRGFNAAFSELGAEVFEQSDLLVGEAELALSHVLREA